MQSHAWRRMVALETSCDCCCVLACSCKVSIVYSTVKAIT
jgi:hypothetical protein